MSGNNRKIYILLALTTMLWGSIYPANKALTEVAPTFTLLCLRYLIAAVFMTTYLQRRKQYIPSPKRTIEKGDRRYIILFGIGAFALCNGLQLAGTKMAGASLASLINSMSPIAICILAVIFLHEKLTARKVVCVICAVTGAALVVSNSGGESHRIGIVFSLAAMITWGIVSVFMRSFSQKYDALTITTYGIYASAIATFPLMIWEISAKAPKALWQPEYILLLLYVSIICTAATHMMWNYCLSKIEASQCSLFMPIQPLTSMLLGVVLLGETISLNLVVGAVLTVIGILYSTMGERIRSEHV